VTSSVSAGPLIASITVELLDLRQGLASTLPHLDRAKDAPSQHSHLHVTVDPSTRLASITASNGHYSLGLALVSVTDSTPLTAPLRLDLDRGTADDILRIFPSRDLSPDNQLQIDIHEQYVVATDVGGLIAGKQGRWPRAPLDDMPVDFVSVIRDALQRVEDRVVVPRSEPATYDYRCGAKAVAMFRAAGEAYGTPLRIQSTGSTSPVLVSAGDSFLGLLIQPTLSDREQADEATARRGWLQRLQVVTPTTEATRELVSS